MAPATVRELTADEHTLRLGSWGDATVDICFDGRRVWSVAAADHPADRNGTVKIDWPARLRPKLHGVAEVSVNDHLTGEVIARATVAFRGGTGPLDLTDADGRPLSLTKWGRFNRSFDTVPAEVKEGYLDDLENVLRVLRDECGVQPFIAYGALLGAVREGKLIGHDVDADVGYLSEFSHPSDIARETFRIERTLRAHGMRVVRQSAGFLALHFRQLDDTERNIDIFTAFMVDGVVYETNDLQMVADVDDMLPLSTVRCEGRTLPAPARPERYLEAAFGPGWRVPDPGFAYDTPRRLRRMMTGWFGQLRRERNWWREHSEGRPAGDPSDFARWVGDRLPAGVTVVDVGCGLAADSGYFAGNGHRVVGVDFVAGLGARFRRATRNKRRSRFVNLNLYALDETLRFGARLAREPGDRAVYARRLFDDLRPDGRDAFWRLAAMALHRGGRCWVETAVGEPSGPSASRSLSLPPAPAVLVAEAERAGGRVVESVELGGWSAQGLPLRLLRLVVEWCDDTSEARQR
jgi:SAM-dependent methyltransferase